MGEGHRCHECTRAHCPGCLAFGLANRISRRDYLHQHDPHLTLGGDCGIDRRGRGDTHFEIAAVSLRSIQTRRIRNGAEQSGLRPKPSRSQSELGSARSRSGRRDGTNLRIFGSGYHRNACKQSERGVPPNVTCPWRATRSRLSFSRSPDGWPRGSQLRAPLPSHRPTSPAAECSSGRCSSNLSPFRRCDGESVQQASNCWRIDVRLLVESPMPSGRLWKWNDGR
jgi:hypothetical protein